MKYSGRNSRLWFRYSVKYVSCNNPDRDLTIVTTGATYGSIGIDEKELRQEFNTFRC